MIYYIFDNIPDSGKIFFDPDTIACPNSLKSYLLAAGGCIDAVNLILNSKKNNETFFCAHRPPGHHAEKNKAMGFGVFNKDRKSVV